MAEEEVIKEPRSADENWEFLGRDNVFGRKYDWLNIEQLKRYPVTINLLNREKILL